MTAHAHTRLSSALVFLAGTLLPGIVFAASASPFEKVDVTGNPVYLQALRDWQASDFDAVLESIRPLAEHGDAIAQFLLGGLYSEGRGVEQDDERAAQWWLMAAEQGVVPAQNEVGVALADGRGVPANAAQAVMWYRKAAERGLAVAQLNLGLMYAKGLGVRRDDREAAVWFRKAAGQGLGWGQFYLGYAYLRGLGVLKNEGQAAELLRKAAEQNYTEAQYNLGLMYSRGEGVHRDRSQAAHWLAHAAQSGHEAAEWSLQSVLPGLAKILLGDSIVVRKRPNESAEVITSAGKNEAAYELSRLTGWVEIYLKDAGIVGYIAAEQAPAAPTHRASGSSPR